MGRSTNPFDGSQYFIPNQLRKDLMPQLGIGCSNMIKECAKELVSKGWRIYVCEQARGWCKWDRKHGNKVIVIPAWVLNADAKRKHRNAINDPIGYKQWYVAHEFAHAYQMEKGNWSESHGDNFMQELIRICPNESLKYEIDYKPRNAGRNGITENGHDPMSEFGF